MIMTNLPKLAEDLEKQELEAPKGIAPHHVYAQLLAIYLHENDLCNAKYLLKRIPINIDDCNNDLYKVLLVGRKMWKRDFPGTYETLSTTQWTECVADIMKSLEEKVRERAITLISQAYSSISIETMASMTGLKNDQVLEFCKQRGWSVQDEGKMIHPVKPQPPPAPQTSSEDQLYKLTEFVSFLEN